jgi:tRNA-splicing ligase RtcB
MNIFGTHDENTLKQFREVEQRAVKAALMADGHFGYVCPVGGVVAYQDEVSVVAVGVDIACGNCAIKTDMNINDLGKSSAKRQFMLTRVADDIAKSISFGMGRTNNANDAPVDHALFQSDAWVRLRERAGHGNARSMFDKAIQQLGTVGGGNHYVDVFTDEDGDIWVGVHFGSRGLGHNIAQGFMALGQGQIWGDRVPEVEVILSLHSSLGQDYWELMSLAGEYAFAGREWVTRKVVEILGAKEIEMVHNNHNFAWKEHHYIPQWNELSEVVVVRKGATPAFPGQKGFVGGSMGDVSVILEGAPTACGDPNAHKVDELMEETLYSTVHGAGRVMSRTEAKGKMNRKTGELKLDGNGNPVKIGKVTREMMDEWCNKIGVIRRGGDVDEAPHVYRRLPDVLKSQGDTIRILHTLTPLIAVMADVGVYDQYKD